MKKLLIILWSAILVLGLCSCGTPADHPASSGSSDVQGTVSESTGKNETAKKLIIALDQIDRLGGGAVELDRETNFPQGGALYCKVTDPQYTSLNRIRELLDDTLTEKMISERYSALLGGEEPMYLEKDGVLYCKDAAKGCGFALSGDVTVKDNADGSFTAEQNYDDFGAAAVLSVHVVSEQGKYKIDSMKTR